MPKEQRRFTGLENLCADECAVDEYRELTSEFIGRGGIQPFGDESQASPHLALVSFGDFPGRMVCFRELGSHVDLRAPAIVQVSNPLADPVKMGVQLRLGVVRVLFRYAIPLAPESLIFPLQEGRNEIVLSAEVTIETGFGDASFLDHEVDTNSPGALFVE